MLTSQQVLHALRRLEPRHRLTYQQLRDLERRGCVAPKAMHGARGPRLYDVGDVLLLRLVVRMQADPLLLGWQAWAVVAHLREELRSVMLARSARALVVRGALGRLVTTSEATSEPGVDFPLAGVVDGVREAMKAAAGEVWTGAQWVSSRQATAYLKTETELVNA